MSTESIATQPTANAQPPPHYVIPIPVGQEMNPEMLQQMSHWDPIAKSRTEKVGAFITMQILLRNELPPSADHPTRRPRGKARSC